MSQVYNTLNYHALAEKIKVWGQELGFQQVGITDIDLSQAESRLQEWLAKGFQGNMDYMARHGTMRSRPAELLPKTIRVISVRIDYLPKDANMIATLRNKLKAYISRYALGRDYHKLIRKRLAKLCQRIETEVGPFNHRVFADSAPVMEKPLAEKAGLGWIGKSTNLIHPKAGSWFFLGTIYTDVPLPIDNAFERSHCGSCNACIDICPTQAIIAPYQLDASRCISYLTIENRGSIPIEFRAQMGNRIYGCDDCQIVCPWNKFAKTSAEIAFHARHQLDSTDLLELFAWTEDTFLSNLEGSAIRRIGHQAWLRNIAVALGNAPYSVAIVEALQKKRLHSSDLVREHVEWALAQQGSKSN